MRTRAAPRHRNSGHQRSLEKNQRKRQPTQPADRAGEWMEAREMPETLTDSTAPASELFSRRSQARAPRLPAHAIARHALQAKAVKTCGLAALPIAGQVLVKVEAGVHGLHSIHSAALAQANQAKTNLGKPTAHTYRVMRQLAALCSR